MSEDELRITVGWRYLVHSQGGADKDLVSSGTFIGYTALGQDTAMVIELDQGPEVGPKRNRIIPVEAILYLELLERHFSTLEKEKDNIYFG